jgi:hypothetical protein
VIGYDIDGVLASKPPLSEKKWGRMNGDERKAYKAQLLVEYANARPLLKPTEPFIAISARKNDDVIYNITLDWLHQHHGDLVVSMALLPFSRTVENVVAFKSSVIEQYGLTDFTEDNKAILKGLSQLGLSTRLWYWVEGMAEPVPYTGVK